MPAAVFLAQSRPCSKCFSYSRNILTAVTQLVSRSCALHTAEFFPAITLPCGKSMPLKMEWYNGLEARSSSSKHTRLMFFEAAHSDCRSIRHEKFKMYQIYFPPQWSARDFIEIPHGALSFAGQIRIIACLHTVALYVDWITFKRRNFVPSFL